MQFGHQVAFLSISSSKRDTTVLMKLSVRLCASTNLRQWALLLGRFKVAFCITEQLEHD